MSRRSLALAFAIFAVTAAWLYGRALAGAVQDAVPTLPTSPRHRPVVRADHQWVVWAVARNARTLVTRPQRLFDAEQCFPDERSLALGEPVIAMGALGVPAWLLSRDPIVTYNGALWLRTVVAALAMYWLVASWTGRASAGIAAGLLYGFSGLAVRDVVHPYAADTTGIVLALVFAERLFARGRWRDAAGLAAAGAFQLATSFYAMIASFLVALPFAGFLLVRYRPWKLRLSQVAVVALVALSVAAFVLGPYLEQRDAGVLSGGRRLHFLPWADWLPGGRAFFGGLGLSLAVAGLVLPERWSVAAIRTGVRWPLALAGVLVATVAAGPHAPVDLYGLLAGWIPGLDAVRLPRKIASGAELVLCVLAGLGFAGLLAALERWRARASRPAAALGVAACAAVVAGALPDYEPLPLRPKQDLVEFHQALAASGNAGPIYETPIPGYKDQLFWPGSAAYLLLAEFHRRKTSACYPSHPQPHRGELERIERALPAPGAVRSLSRLGFTTVVVHHPQRGPGWNQRRRSFASAARRQGSPLRELRTSREMSAYAIEPKEASW